MTRETVVLLHGVWMPASEMLMLKHRLASDYGFDCHALSYPSVRGTLDENAATIAASLKELDAERLHVVGHSLGGVMALRMLATVAAPVSGRIVCLGSPLCGSKAAAGLSRMRWGKLLLGESLPSAALDEPASVWAADVVRDYDIGIIAGDMATGVGRLFADFKEPNDGTVAVSETELPGARDHIVLPVNHTGMILSAAVADQTAAFLKRGEFLRED